MTEKFQHFLDTRKTQHLLRSLKRVQSSSSPRFIRYQDQTFLNFSSNDYLGLSTHPDLAERSARWAHQYGTGSGASRLVTGNLECLEQTETKLAHFKKSEDALIMASGFQANASILQALLDPKIHGSAPLVFADRLNHASMHFGCAAAGIRQIRYRHLDMAHLRQQLERHHKTGASHFILTESIFSMDGDIAPLSHIRALAREFGAFLIVDDAHGFGCMGKNGEGLSQDADMTIGTFSKAAGCFGAYVACSRLLKEYLVNKCSGIIYSTALPPNLLGAIDAALDLIPRMNDQRQELHTKAEKLRQGLQNLGMDTGHSQSQIVPALTGTASQATLLQKKLAKAGIWATAIRPPTVPQGRARIRFTCHAAHKKEDVDHLLTSIAKFNGAI